MARYGNGETLSSIARTYDCSPPAISYIVNRSRGKLPVEIAAPPASETQLVKARPNGDAANGSAAVEPIAVPPPAMLRRELAAEPASAAVGGGDGAARGDAFGGEARRKLHLSLGNRDGNGNGGVASDGHGHGPDTSLRPSLAAPRPQQAPPQQPVGDRPDRQPFGQPQRSLPPFDTGRAGKDLYALSEGRPSAQQPRDSDVGAKGNGAFIDQELRTRVDGDIAAFLAAFDAALAADTQESRFGLREATDRLLRAGARTRIELERLEARVPLAPRDGAAERDPGAWRPR